MKALVVGGALVVGAWAACYSPSVATEVPCAANLACPHGQVCDLGRAPPVCVAGGDAALPGSDGPLVDAPPASCAMGATCPAATPVCGNDAVCRGCIADAECVGGVCHELDGTCVADDAVLFASAAGVDGAPCTRALPCSLLGALGQATAARNFIRVADGTYVGTLTAPAFAMTLSGERAGYDDTHLTATAGDIVTVGDTSVLAIEGMSIENGPADGIRSVGALTLYRVRLHGNTSSGLDARGASTVITESRIDNNARFGVTTTGFGGGMAEGAGEFDMERTVVATNTLGGLKLTGKILVAETLIAGNGTTTSAVGGVQISGTASTAALRFVTIADNADASTSGGVYCAAAGTVVQDAIVANNLPAATVQIAAACAVEYTLVSGTTAAPGTGNRAGNPQFVDPMPPADYHLSLMSPAIDSAEPGATGDTEDLDGNPRPLGGGWDMGAYESH